MARKTVLVPRLSTVEDTALQEWLATPRTSLGEGVLKTWRAVEFVVFGHESTGSNLLLADLAYKAFLVPVVAVVFQT